MSLGRSEGGSAQAHAAGRRGSSGCAPVADAEGVDMGERAEDLEHVDFHVHVGHPLLAQRRREAGQQAVRQKG